VDYSAGTDDLDEKCNSPNKQPLGIPAKLSADQKIEIRYTYSVKFEQNNSVKWSSRWDYILGTLKVSNNSFKHIILIFIFYHSRINATY
jgi:hypothetical protein